MAMVDQIPIQSHETHTQSSPLLFNNLKDARDFLITRNTFLDTFKSPETLKIQEHKINKVRQATSQDNVRRTFTLDSHYICSISAENSILVKSNENIVLTCAIENIQSPILDICLYEGLTSSALGIICKDGNITGYRIELNETKNNIIIRHFLSHRLEGEIEQPQIMWKDMYKLGVSLRNELTIIEAVPLEEKNEKNREHNDQSKPRSFNVQRFDTKIRYFCFSPRYSLAYILFEDNIIRVVNADNGLTIREFVPHKSRVIRMLIYRNLAKPAPPANTGPPQMVKVSKDHDYSLKDVFITITDDFEVKVWDLSEWDSENKTYFCLEGMHLKHNFAKAEPQSIIQTFFDLKRQFLFITCSQNGNKETSVVAIQINDFFQKFQENYGTQKKQVKFCGCVTKILLQKPNIIDIAALTAYDSARVQQPKENTEAQRNPSDSSEVSELNIEPLFSFVVEADKYLTLLYVLRERLPSSPSKESDSLVENDNLSQKEYLRYSCLGQQNEMRVNLASLYPNHSDKSTKSFELNLGGINRTRDTGFIPFGGMGLGLDAKLDAVIESQVQKAFERYMSKFEEVIEKKVADRVSEFKGENFGQKSIEEISDEKQANSLLSESEFEKYSNKIMKKVEKILEDDRTKYRTQLRLHEEQQAKTKEIVDQNLNSFSQIIAVLTQVVTTNQNSVSQLENTIQTRGSERSELVGQINQILEREKEFYAKIQEIERSIQEMSTRPHYKGEPLISPNIDINYHRIIQQATSGKSEPNVSEAYRKVMQEIYNSLLKTNRLGLNIPKPSYNNDSARPVSATQLDVPTQNSAEKPVMIDQNNLMANTSISRTKSLDSVGPEFPSNPTANPQNYEYYQPYSFNKESLPSPQPFTASPILSQQAFGQNIQNIQNNQVLRNSPLQQYYITQVIPENVVSSARLSLQQQVSDNRSASREGNQLLDAMNERSPVNANKSFTGSEGLCIQNVFAFPSGGEQGEFVGLTSAQDETEQGNKDEEHMTKPPGLSWEGETEDNLENLLPKDLLQEDFREKK